MARKRPADSNVVPPVLTCLDGGRLTGGTVPLLTRAEAEALRRSAPLTHQQLRKHLTAIPAPNLRGV